MSSSGDPITGDDRVSAQLPKPGHLIIDEPWYQEYCKSKPGAILYGWERLSYFSRRRRAYCSFPYELKEDVVEKLCWLDHQGLRRLVNVKMAFENVFLFSQPEYYPRLIKRPEYNRFMRWVVSSEVHHPGEAVSQWKDFLSIVKWKAVRSHTEPPNMPTCFPGLSRKDVLYKQGLSKFWEVLTPFLVPIWDRGLSSKDECTRLMHFATSRNMPAASVTHRQRTLIEHAEVLTTPGPDNPERARLLYQLAYMAGRQIQPSPDLFRLGDAHLSVTSSACLENPVKQGGRGTFISVLFKEWISQIPETTVQKETWFGRPYWLQEGIPLWRTMCRDELGDDGEPGDSSFITDVEFVPGKYKYEDPLYCLDKYTGYLILQWSIEYGIATNALCGSKFRDDSDPLRIGPRAPGIYASAIGEPGNKSRVVTVGEAWLTEFLQPYSHALIAIMRTDPSARAGLTRGWQGFEYIKSWSTKDSLNPPSPEERYILSSDLKTATDFCPRLYSRSLLRGFTHGLGLSGPMLNTWIDLLTGPRFYIGPSFSHAGKLTERGVLMGDPGTKLVLSLFNKVAEMEAMLRYHLLDTHPRPSNRFLVKQAIDRGIKGTRFRLFAFAGDDHIAIGPERYLKAITLSHIRNGMKVSGSTNYLSAIAGFYCEECIFIKEESVWRAWGNKCPLYKQLYADNPHVDALKIRLFSLCTKEHDEQNETNPAIGMASMLRGMIAWFAEGWEVLRPICAWRFAQIMGILLPQNLMLRGIHRSLGGLEAPLFGYSKEQLKADWERIPITIRKAIAVVRRQEYTPERRIFRSVLSRYSTSATQRGVDANSIEEQVRQVLTSELCQVRKLDDLRPDHIDQGSWDNLRFRDKLNVIQKEGGFISITEAINVINRPYVFRGILFPEQALKHGENPWNAPYRNIPWDRREANLVKALCESLGSSDSLRATYLSVTERELEETRDSIIESLEQPYLLSLPSEIEFIPKSVVYTDKLCTLRTPGIKP